MIRANRRNRRKKSLNKVWDEPRGSGGKSLALPVYRMRPGETPAQFANRKDRMEQIAANRAHERETMPREEIERRIVQKLIECAKAARPFTEADIRSINVPFKEAQRMLKRCVARAELEFPELRNRIFSEAA
ncbi:MAG TPA: hypothetical protein VKR31_10290 [Rhizomicrobium sp.]|nr:hypothetical protein [Rhizomicrobium sp.]